MPSLNGHSVIEQQRNLHEEIERLQDAVVQYYLQNTQTTRTRLTKEHIIKDLMDRMAFRSKMLYEMYEDLDGSRKAELDALSKGTGFAEFQVRLKQIREYHRKNPNQKIEYADIDIVDLDKDTTQITENMFTGEEGYGRFLDLIELHEQYINLKDSHGEPLFRKITYLAYLDTFDQFVSIPIVEKGEAYIKYLGALYDYLLGFYKRVKPLLNPEEIINTTLEKFNQDWDAGHVPGWPKELNPSDTLFCKACQKVFSKQSVYDAHLTGKKHLKAVERLKESGNPNESLDPTQMTEAHNAAKDQRSKIIAQTEILICSLAQALKQQREDTKSNVERKQSLTDRERFMEQEEEVEQQEISGQQEDENEEEEIYNPLKLPLGWDGRPIPYWLYKLHGLGVQYPCEICGNYVYMGRKAFDRHFQEARHTQAMKALGIPNTRHFQEITKIADALQLAERLKGIQKQELFNDETMEEYEDAQGNVYTKKTYEDLKRQGLL